jgi:MFS family permease
VRQRARLGIVSPIPLRSPAFRRWLLASTVVNICLWTYVTGLSWTMLARTGSAASVSLIQVLMTVPLPLVMLPAGLLTDRFGSRSVMRVAYAGYATCVALTGALLLGDALPVVAVLGLAFALGCFDALNVVASPVFVGRSVPPEVMPAAIGLSTLSAGLGRIAGGPLGGLVVGTFGPSAALIPAAVALVVALGIATTLPRVTGAGSAVRWRLADVTAGIEWARRVPIARLVISLGATMALLVSGYIALLSITTRELVGGGAAELGLLTAVGGIGVIAASFVIDAIGRRVGRVRTAITAIALAAVLLAALASSRTLAVTALVVGLLSACSATYSATTNLLLQSSASASMRGRAVAVYGLVFYALQPVGLVVTGLLSDRLGVAAVLVGMSGATLVAITVIVATNRAIWPDLLARRQPAAPEAIPVATTPTAAPRPPTG